MACKATTRSGKEAPGEGEMAVGTRKAWVGVVGADVGVELEGRVRDAGEEHEPSKTARQRAARRKVRGRRVWQLRCAERCLIVDAF
jgi:hypothetical protein